MWGTIGEKLRSLLGGDQSDTIRLSRKRRREGSESTESNVKRPHSDDAPSPKRFALLKTVTDWMVSKQRSLNGNIFIHKIKSSPRALMKKLSSLSSLKQDEGMPERQTYLQPGMRMDQSGEVHYSRDIMSAMQGMQIHSTPMNNPVKGFNFTDANFDLDTPERFNFHGNHVDPIKPNMTATIQDLGSETGLPLTRPPLRSQFKNRSETPNKSVYEKVFSEQGKPRRRYHGQRYRSKMTVKESVQLLDRQHYAELLQQYTTAPIINKPFIPSSAKELVPNHHESKADETIIGTQVTDIGPEQSDHKHRSVLEKVEVKAKQMKTSKEPDGFESALFRYSRVKGSWPDYRLRLRSIQEPIEIDLTESSDNLDKCSEKSPSSTSESKSEELRRRTSSPTAAYSFTQSLQDSKYIKDEWLQEIVNKINLESQELKSKAEEEEIKAKYYKEKRKIRDESLERRIQLRLQLSERQPCVIEESFEEEEEDEGAEEFPELTEEQHEMVDAALVPYPGDEKLAEGFRLELTRNDIHSLYGLNWLNDEVINFYMNLLMERSAQKGYPKVYAFNTFFYPKIMQSGQQSVRRWTKKVDIFSMDYILVPVHMGVHWCLAVINFRKKEIQYYDSMGGSNKSCLEALRKYLIDESLDKKKQRFDMSNWKLVTKKDIPQQLNGSDCGMFACKFAEYITRDAPITFSQEHMPYFRRRMVYEILTKQLM